MITDFGEDAMGLGHDELRKGNSIDLVRSKFYQGLGNSNAERNEALEQMTREREKWRPCLYRSLQKALRDVRAYTYDEVHGKWKPSSRQKRVLQSMENATSQADLAD
ncbi:unnamed protein product [Cylicocyclus nassatus]|uniref:Uncharacterized protein n=1 Tax=Cylicocyclus nassatus TaxID=53992 RepID=A0AA36M8A0_CYLNA|nr:unnamed protein product [Cylicocyclus nassatus]